MTHDGDSDTKNLEKRLDELKSWGKIETIQKASQRSAKLLAKVQESWRDII